MVTENTKTTEQVDALNMVHKICKMQETSHQSIVIVTLLWVATHLCSLREVSDILYSGPPEFGHHVGIPKGHPPMEVVTVSM